MTVTVQTPLTGSAVITASTAPGVGKINVYNATSGAISVSLPAMSGLNVGARLIVSKYSGDISANTVTVSCSGSDTFINPAVVSFVLTVPGEQKELQVVLISGTKYWAVVGSVSAGGGGGGGSTPAVKQPFEQTELAAGVTTVPRLGGFEGIGYEFSSGKMLLSYFYPEQNRTVSTVTFSFRDAGGVATLAQAGLYSVDAGGALTLLGSTVNDVNFPANSWSTVTKSLSSSASLVAGSTYALGVLVVSTNAMPGLAGTSGQWDELSLPPRLAGAVYGQSSLPASITAGSVTSCAVIVYARFA